MLQQVGLLNVDGYYDNLLTLFDKGVEQGFIDDHARQIVIAGETAVELLHKMEVMIILHYISIYIYIIYKYDSDFLGG